MNKEKIAGPEQQFLIKRSAGSFSNEYGVVRDYYLCGEIGAAENYTEMFHEIRSAREYDVIRLHINSPGGDLFTTIQFLQAMVDSDGHIVASVEGACMSAATMIFLMANECIIGDHSVFLFHNYSGGTAGKGGEMYRNIIHQRKWTETLLKDIYEGFLTESELSELINDKDIWMDSKQVVERLRIRGEAISKKIEAAKKKAKKKVTKPRKKATTTK